KGFIETSQHRLIAPCDRLLIVLGARDIEHTTQNQKALGARWISPEPLPELFGKCERLFEHILVHHEPLMRWATVRGECHLKIATLEVPLSRFANAHLERFESGCRPVAHVEAFAVDALDLPLPTELLVPAGGACVARHAG